MCATVVCLAFAFVQSGNAQDSVDPADSSAVNLRITLLDSDMVADLNFERDELVEWLQKLKLAIEQNLGSMQGQHEFALVVTFSPDGRGEVQVGARPVVSDSLLALARGILNSVPAPKPAVSDYSILMNIDVNGGNRDSTLKFSPSVLLPTERDRILFLRKDIVGKRKALRDWSRQQVLPLLAEIAIRADSNFIGLNSLGQRIKGTIAGNFFRVDKLCNRNPDYWRGITQLKAGNFLVPAIKLFCLTAEGRFDWANRYLFFMNIFADSETVAGDAMLELSWRLNEYYKSYNKLINDGIGLTDQGQHEAAKSLFDSLIVISKYSAWVEYERYYTSTKMTSGDNKQLLDSMAWIRTVKKVYDADPLYPLRARVYNGQEAYQVSRRNEVNGLFQKPQHLYMDLFIYSDIAMDTGEYGFAAELLWILLTSAPQQSNAPSRDVILVQYLYCLHKLEQHEVVAQFRGDYTEDFKRIDAERDQRMKASQIYQRFERKE